MVVGNRQRQLIVAKLQGEFSAPQKSLVFPTAVIGVGRKSWKPLGQEKQLGIGFLKIFVTAATAHGDFLKYIELPVDRETDCLTGCQGRCQIQPCHGVDDGGFDGLTVVSSKQQTLVTIGGVCVGLLLAQGAVTDPIFRDRPGALVKGIPAKTVLIELKPQVAQRIGTVVGVGNVCARLYPTGGGVQPGGYAIVGALLPIVGTRGTGGRSVDIRVGQLLTQLGKGLTAAAHMSFVFVGETV